MSGVAQEVDFEAIELRERSLEEQVEYWQQKHVEWAGERNRLEQELLSMKQNRDWYKEAYEEEISGIHAPTCPHCKQVVRDRPEYALVDDRMYRVSGPGAVVALNEALEESEAEDTGNV